MKQYIYKPAELGFAEWPSGLLRLDGIEVTENPAEADFFVVPPSLMHFPDPARLDSFPYMKAHADRHVFFDVSDYEPLYKKPCLFIRCNVRNWYLKDDPNTISWAWPVENFAECIEPPEGGFRYDLSFQGWVWSDVRIQSVASCQQAPGLKCDVSGYSDFTGYIYDTPEGIRRRKEFRRSMKESRIALCGESIPGVFPYRFFEALSAARIPLLIGSDYVFPFAKEIPYSDFVLTLPAREAPHAGAAVTEYLKRTPDAELIERGKLGRRFWERYLNRDDWAHTMAEAVKAKCSSS